MRILIIFFICFITKTAAGQYLTIENEAHPIYEMEARLMDGEKSALFEIAKYFDSKKEKVEYLGYHRLETTESKIAQRIVLENCLFTDSEIKITESTTTKQFIDFLNHNKDKIVFSKLATSFLITPLEQRNVNVEIRAISDVKKQELRDSIAVLFSPAWVKQRKIDSLAIQKDPFALLLIASELYKIRPRFNRYHFYQEEFINLLQCLTGTEIGIEDMNQKICWNIDKVYNSEPKLNLLFYLSKVYNQYVWDEKKAVFVNPLQVIKPIEKEDLLFQLLSSQNDSIALDAFTQLTTCNPHKVNQLADEYESLSIDENYSIPTFPYSFLKQLALLTDYCRTNNIDFLGTKELQNNISLLQTKLTFPERRKLEDRLVATLNLDNITAFEYWALIHEKSWYLTYSAGRVLDIFYSKHWSKLLADRKHLDCYLKKSALYDNIGIIGTCNDFLIKFSDASPSTLALINNHKASDKEVKRQIDKINSLNNNKMRNKPGGSFSLNSNTKYGVEHLKQQLDSLTKTAQSSPKTDEAIFKILSEISYSQIPTALEAIETYTFQTSWKQYSFMRDDWGFFMVGDFYKKEARDEFLNLYAKLTEYELYAYYLDQGGIDYRTREHKLDYDKIYELLKYDVVVAFVGGGGSKMSNEVYALVKLLELTFNTKLGFPDKLCSLDIRYDCYAVKRAKSWMQYLSDNKLLMQKHEGPKSFNDE